jgi:hypothetical protein
MGRPTYVCATRTLFSLVLWVDQRMYAQPEHFFLLLRYWNEPIDGRNLDIISMINEYMTSQSFSNLVYDQLQSHQYYFYLVGDELFDNAIGRPHRLLHYYKNWDSIGGIFYYSLVIGVLKTRMYR